MAGDYIMRQIENMTRALGALLFAKKPDTISILGEDGTVSSGSLLAFKLKSLLNEGEINKAENLLFETVSSQPFEEYLPIAIDFYTDLQKLTDEELTARNFSQQEILEGLAEITEIFKREGYDAPG